MTKKSKSATRVVSLPAHLEIRAALTPEARTTVATDHLRGCEVLVKLAVGSDSCDQLRNEWRLLHRLAEGYFPRPVEFRMLTSSTAYLTTAYMGGEPFLTSPAIEDEAVFFAVIKQALEGLSLIHHAGYVHGDIRPQNLMVTGDAKEPRAVWTDFEHAISVNSPYAGMTYVEGFADPGLGNGYGQSPRTDLFALGQTILTRVPDEAELRTGWGEVMLRLAESLCEPSPVDCLIDAEQALLFLDKLAQDEGLPVMPPRPCFRPPTQITNVEARLDWHRRWPGWARRKGGLFLGVAGAAGSGKTTFLRAMGAELALQGHAVLDLLGGYAADVESSHLQSYVAASEQTPVVMIDAADVKSFQARHKKISGTPLIWIIESADEADPEGCDDCWTYPGLSQRRWYQWVTASI